MIKGLYTKAGKIANFSKFLFEKFVPSDPKLVEGESRGKSLQVHNFNDFTEKIQLSVKNQPTLILSHAGY
jgi:hypothetical protein